MAFLRLQDNVPDVYVNYSRDFQLLDRAYDVINNEVLYHINTIKQVTDTNKCPNRLLGLLQTKLGFYSNINFSDEELRLILDAFPSILKHKGSIIGIKECVCVFLKSQHLDTIATITVTTKHFESGQESYAVYIGVKSAIKNLNVLKETLKYVLPTGYIIVFYFYSNITQIIPYHNVLNNNATILFVTNNINSDIVQYANDTIHTLVLPDAYPEDKSLSDKGKSLVTILNSIGVADKSDNISEITITKSGTSITSIKITTADGDDIVIPESYILFDKKVED